MINYSHFSASQYINFYPYVGKDYEISRHKILVLGESHYGPQSNNGYHEWTREVIEKDFLVYMTFGYLFFP